MPPRWPIRKKAPKRRSSASRLELRVAWVQLEAARPWHAVALARHAPYDLTYCGLQFVDGIAHPRPRFCGGFPAQADQVPAVAERCRTCCRTLDRLRAAL